MFGIGASVEERECGVVIDVGSGSVGVAIVVSDVHEEKPTMVWSKREFTTLGDIIEPEITLKHINTALINVFLQLGTGGMKALHAFDSSLKVTHVQVAISAPWSHSVVKQVNFSDDHPFEVTQELIAELTKTATQKATKTVFEDTALQEKGVIALDNKNIGIITNGYRVPQVVGAKTRELSIAHLTALSHKKIMDVLEDSQNKLFPRAKVFTHSFMYLYYEVMQSLAANTKEACLVDITSEATEIGIIRDGLLTHVTHIPFGTFTLAREIASVCEIPKEEAYTYLKGGESFIEKKLSKDKKNDLSIILTAHEERVAKLFQRTGDRLAIPKTLFMHTDVHTEPFFKKQVTEAATIATGIQHQVHVVSSNFFPVENSLDTALLLSATYFNNQHKAAYHGG